MDGKFILSDATQEIYGDSRARGGTVSPDLIDSNASLWRDVFVGDGEAVFGFSVILWGKIVTFGIGFFNGIDVIIAFGVGLI